MRRISIVVAAVVAFVTLVVAITTPRTTHHSPTSVHRAAAHDVSLSLAMLTGASDQPTDVADDDALAEHDLALAPPRVQAADAVISAPVMTTPAGSAAIEQKSLGTKPPADLVASFDGLGANFAGPPRLGRASQSVGQHARRGTRSHRPDREFTHGDLHEEGPPV